MPLKTMGVVLNTIEHPYAHLILFQYDEDAMSGTSPMCQLLKAIHNYQPYYAMKRTNIMPCKWYDVYGVRNPTKNNKYPTTGGIR